MAIGNKMFPRDLVEFLNLYCCSDQRITIAIGSDIESAGNLNFMNLGHGSTQRDKPKKAFESSKDNKRLDFGESSIPQGSVYRARGKEQKSWVWIIAKLIVLGFILVFLGAIIVEIVSDNLRHR